MALFKVIVPLTRNTHDARTGSLHRAAQTAWPGILEVGHLDDAAAAAAHRRGAEPFGGREGLCGLHCRPGGGLTAAANDNHGTAKKPHRP